MQNNIQLLDDNIKVEYRKKLITEGSLSLIECDLNNAEAGMDWCSYKEVKGDEISELEKNIDEFLIFLTSQERDELTVESIVFQLRSYSDLLFFEYKSIHSKFIEETEKYSIFLTHGVSLNDQEPERYVISIFYFRGDMDSTCNVTKSTYEWEEFIKQVRYVERCLKQG